MPIALAFQSTPLREGRLHIVTRRKRGKRFQSTPLREGRLSVSECYVDSYAISIHAPAGGATLWDAVFTEITTFQSTPLREGRRLGDRLY